MRDTGSAVAMGSGSALLFASPFVSRFTVPSASRSTFTTRCVTGFAGVVACRNVMMSPASTTAGSTRFATTRAPAGTAGRIEPPSMMKESMPRNVGIAAARTLKVTRVETTIRR